MVGIAIPLTVGIHYLMTYVALGRVSTDAQGNNLSRDVQFKTIHSYADGQGWSCVGELFDTASGSEKGLEEREGLKEAIRLIETKQADALVMYDVTRAGREGSVVDGLIKSVYDNGGVFGIAVEGRYFKTAADAKEQTFWTKSVAEWERVLIEKRTSNGKRRAIELGGFVFKPLTGYKLVPERRVKVLAVDTEIAPLIQAVFERLIAGSSKTEVAQYAQSRGFEWDVRKIGQLVKDAHVYAGGKRNYSVRIQGEKVEVSYTFPRIVTTEIAEEVKAKTAINYRRDARPTPYLGVLFCQVCGSRAGIARRYNKGKSAQLVCNSHARGLYQIGKGRKAIEKHSHSVSEKYVTKVVLMFLANGDGFHELLIDGYRELVRHSRGRMNRVNQVFAAIEKERDRISRRIIHLEESPNVVTVLEKQLEKLTAREKRLEPVLHFVSQVTDRAVSTIERYESTDFHATAAKAAEAIKEQDWKTANALIASLGVQVSADFSRPNVRDTLYVSGV